MAKYGLMLALTFFFLLEEAYRNCTTRIKSQHNKLEALGFTVWYITVLLCWMKMSVKRRRLWHM